MLARPLFIEEFRLFFLKKMPSSGMPGAMKGFIGIFFLIHLMPVWLYTNAQQAVARAGGDAKMGAYTDAGLTLFVMLPMVFLPNCWLFRCTVMEVLADALATGVLL